MIKIYAGDAIAYDSRLEDYNLLALSVTAGVNKGGSLEFTMPPDHPAYNKFTSYKTIVEVYRDDVRLFRGRALYPTDDFFNRRTITCEGERCFLRDAVMRPYDYQDSPAAVFTAVIGEYNAQVDADKQFALGTVAVTDPNDYIRLYTESAEQVSDTIDKLVERCGGYIVFTTNSSGQRAINWYAELTYRSTQTIEFGENLLDLSRSANTELATRIVPYGAKQEDGSRLTIGSVNDGVDYIQDDDAVAIRGVIARPVYWDDVTLPENLLTKARQYLTTSKMVITTLTLSAVDLTHAGEDIDQFRVGDDIHVISAPHGVDDWMQLTEMTADLLNPANSTVTMGKSYSSLSGADVAGDRESRSDLEQTIRDVTSDYTKNIANAIEEAARTLTSLIQQTSDTIKLMVSETYATNDEVQTLISSQITQLADSVTFQFEQLQAVVDENDAEAREQFEKISTYIRFDADGILLGKEGDAITLRIGNSKISFLNKGAEVAYISDQRLYITDGEFLNSLNLGKFAFIPRANGNLSFRKVVT